MTRRIAGAMAFLLAAASCAPLAPPAPVPGPAPPAPGAPAAAPAPPAALPPFAPSGEPLIRVGLTTEPASVTLTALRRVRLASARGASLGTASWDAGHAFRLVADAGALALRAPSREEDILRLAAGDTLEVRADGIRDAAIGWNGKSWRGAFRAFVNARGAITLVSELPLETYLAGVVPGEIGALSDALVEAGRAQAIAARSYTLFYLGRRAAEGFDLYGTVEDQVYGPLESEKPLATRCVTGTAGRVALSDGRPIRANYCSTCGGITSEVWEAWPVDPLPYLVSHRDRDGGADWCAASPHFRWREEWTAAEFVSDVERFAPAQGLRVAEGGLGDLVDVRVEERSRSGRVWRLRIVGTRSDLVVHAHQLRQVLRRGGNPAAILRSNLFKIDVRRDPATRRALAVVASGAGNGHGAGLCQTGALGMARAGRTGEQIVEHYYRGSELRRLY